ncbi:hypothetical protein RhiirC2_821688 [Rhizophagus irregularis]|uniref:Uncharacterized protein n=1 Tax=Rhizophagus irregularis TaxID=588596 RepID=A0A2N1MBV4_9GLOM|nr:hypothetical protein RhiirC2_821688 [Rhizophagus irregularis]
MSKVTQWLVFMKCHPLPVVSHILLFAHIIEKDENVKEICKMPYLSTSTSPDCCPSIILIIAGPWIYVLGAVYPEKPVIELLTDFILMMNHPEDNGKRVEELAVFFESLHLAFRTLDNYYKGLKGLDEAKAEKIQRFFPYRN